MNLYNSIYYITLHPMEFLLRILGQVEKVDTDIKAEERKRMKESLLAPFERKPPSNTFNKINNRDMDNKFKDVMGFATPNIRPWKRMKHMDQAQIKSHLTLQRMVGDMAGPGGNGSTGGNGARYVLFLIDLDHNSFNHCVILK